MDADESSKAFAVFSKGIGKLCDQLYAATQEPRDESSLAALIAQARDKQREFAELDQALTGGRKASLHSSYSSEMEELEEFLRVLDPPND